jgi:hypothetical protein
MVPSTEVAPFPSIMRGVVFTVYVIFSQYYSTRVCKPVRKQSYWRAVYCYSCHYKSWHKFIHGLQTYAKSKKFVTRGP